MTYEVLIIASRNGIDSVVEFIQLAEGLPGNDRRGTFFLTKHYFPSWS